MSLLGELTYALISSPVRSIGTVIPDVVIEEAHRDELIITQHPVEKGATITDHAFARPGGENYDAQDAAAANARTAEFFKANLK